MTGVEALIISHRLGWAGHVFRMSDERLPKKLLMSELVISRDSGCRKADRPNLRYKDTVKATNHTMSFESNHIQNAEEKRARRNAQQNIAVQAEARTVTLPSARAPAVDAVVVTSAASR